MGLLKQFREGNSARKDSRDLRLDEGPLRPPSQLSLMPGRRPGLVVSPDPESEEVTYAVAILGEAVQGDHMDQGFSLKDPASYKCKDVGDPPGYTGTISTCY